MLSVRCRAPSQYPKIRLFVRSRQVSKPRDLYLELSDRSEIWQALRQQCCRCACQISKRYDNLRYQSRGFETLRDLTKRRIFGYWDGAQGAMAAVWPLQICSITWSLYGGCNKYSILWKKFVTGFWMAWCCNIEGYVLERIHTSLPFPSIGSLSARSN